MLSCISHEAAKVEHQIVKSAKVIKAQAGHEAYKKAFRVHQKYHIKSINHYKRHAMKQVRSIEDMVCDMPHNIESSLCKLAHEAATSVRDCFDGIVDQIMDPESPCPQCDKENKEKADKPKVNAEKDKTHNKTAALKHDSKSKANAEKEKTLIKLVEPMHESKPAKPICPSHNRKHPRGRLHAEPAGKDGKKYKAGPPALLGHPKYPTEEQLTQPKEPKQSKDLKQPDGGKSKKTPGPVKANESPVLSSEPENPGAVGGLLNLFALSSASSSSSVEGLEGFRQLRGSQAHAKFNGMAFVDPEAEDPHKMLFTTRMVGEKACMLFEGSGSGNQNKALGHIFLTWNRLSKGPVFSIGDPYLNITADTHPLTAVRHRAEFSSYSPDKSQKRAPYFTFTFTPHADGKNNKIFSKQMYTWRAAPNKDEESDIQGVELREGDKKNADGQLVAVWKLDEQDDAYIRLFYKVPEGYADDIAKNRWAAALLLTSRCAMEYGMGSGQTLL